MKSTSPLSIWFGSLSQAIRINCKSSALRSGNIVALSGACLLGLCGVSVAAPPGSTWLGGGVDNNWSTSGNWNITPTASGPWQLIYQGEPTRTTSRNDVDADGSTITVSSISFNNNKSLGNTAQFTVSRSGNRTLTLQNAAVVSTTATTVAGNVLEDVISSPIIVPGAASFNLGTDHNLTLSGAITGGGSITKSGLGDLLFTGSTTLGGLTINQGSVGFNTTSISAINSLIVDIGSSGNRGILGTTGVNGSTGVQFKMGGNATIQANLFSNVTFSNPVFNVANPAVGGALTFTLGGGGASNTGIDTVQGVIQDNSATRKVNLTINGLNTWVLDGANTYTGATNVALGAKLIVNGSLNPLSAVTVTGTLGGSGLLGAISGAGSIDPGNSPGILSVSTVDPSAGMDFNFEFTGNNPNYLLPANSVNDVLKLTGGADPFVAALGVANTVNIYFNVPSIAGGDAFTGGFFTSASNTDFISEVAGGAFNFYQQNPLGGVTYGGVKYDLLSPTSFTVSTASVPGGGRVTLFTAVPEPVSAIGTLCFLVSGFLLRRRP